ncbi:zinc metalloprotease HtpX [Hyalangium minutum]|uniref:Protease HtpX homolog n=1 Tax=Hyalangium minutum TaxID=394096 RepID=A0A085WRT5_9BACT|nr:zinc metalloprotease HtpX [Hyalangium minutum]KFE70398.1 Peptidase M48, Ste24p precursor [Hyalangium minutum]
MKNQIKTVVLMGALSAVLIGIGGALGQGYLILAAVIALAMNVGAYFFSDRMVLAMHGAKEVSPAEAPELHRRVEELARNAQLPKPRVFIMEDPQPNAFATGRNPEHGVVAVTTGLMGLLDARELRGVIAHELAHIKNRDILVSTIAATIASAVTFLANAAGFISAFAGGNQDDEQEEGLSPVQSLVLALVAPIAATLIQLGISRSREYLADRTGAEICGDPEALAQALQKLEQGAQMMPSPAARPATASLFIVNPFAGAGSILQLFSTHPSIPERVRRLRALGARREQPWGEHHSLGGPLGT